MDSELMEEIFRTLNRKCAAEDRKILLFIDNVPSHPESFIDCFSHVKIMFLSKNTRSKLQPFDAEIIKNSKVFYRKQLLRHVLARTKPGSKASDVIHSVDLLKSIGWVLLSNSTVDSYLNQDEDAVTSVNTVDIHLMNWKEDMREKAIRFAIEGDDKTEKQAEAHDDFDIERPELKIRSSQAALSIVDDLNNFCETLGDADLVSALSLVTRRLETLRLKNVSQKKVTDYFNKTL